MKSLNFGFVVRHKYTGGGGGNRLCTGVEGGITRRDERIELWVGSIDGETSVGNLKRYIVYFGLNGF